MRKVDCLSDAELLEFASAGSNRSELLQHLESCDFCHQRVKEHQRPWSTERPSAENTSELEADPFRTVDYPFKPTGGPYQPRLTPGFKFEKYRVLKLKGAGGQSEAYLVERDGLAPEVSRCIAKIVRTQERNGKPIPKSELDLARESLKAEAELLLRLQGCRGFPRFLDFGSFQLDSPPPEPFLVMEWIEGRNLRQCLGEFRSDWTKAFRLVAELADAIGEAHEKAVFHGDLKPENIVIDTATGRVKIIDFGMARVRDIWEKGEAAEDFGKTYRYMAPEQARGEEFLMSPATDVFSLGVIFQELLLNIPVYEGTSLDELLANSQHGNINLAPAEQLPDPRLALILCRCLRVAPDERYANGKELATALRSLLAVTPNPTAPSPTLPARDLAWAGWGSLLAVVIGLIIFSNWALFAKPRGTEPREPVGILGFGDDSIPGQKRRPVGLQEAVTLKAEIPADFLDLRWFVIWIDANRQIEIYSENSEDAVEATRLGDTDQAAVRWPATADVRVIGGPAGTQMLFLCGVSPQSKFESAEISDQISQLLPTPDDWPALDPSVAVLSNRDQVKTVVIESKIRGPGSRMINSYRRIEESAEKIRKALREQCPVILGEGFLAR